MKASMVGCGINISNKQTNKQANKHGAYLKSDKFEDFLATEEHVLLLSVIVLERPGRP